MNCSLDIAPKSLQKVSAMTGLEITLKGSGGIAPYRFSIDNGKLPSGVEFDTQKGIISGTPEQEGQYRFTIQMTDAAGSMARHTYTDLVIKILARRQIKIIRRRTNSTLRTNFDLGT